MLNEITVKPKRYNNCFQVSLLLLALFLFFSNQVSAQWYIDCSVAARHLGGPSRLGPYNTRAEAEAVIAANAGYAFKLEAGGRDIGSGSPPAVDYERERRAREAAAKQREEEVARVERERLATEKLQKEKEVEFIRNRDEAASKLKGSVGTSGSPLKGVPSAEHIGVKGSDSGEGIHLKEPTMGVLMDGPFETLLINLDSFCLAYGSGGGKVSTVKAKEGITRLNFLTSKVEANIRGKVGNTNQLMRAQNKLDCAKRSLARLQVLSGELIKPAQVSATTPLSIKVEDAQTRVIQSMLRQAKEIGWSSKKLARLEKSLNDLQGDGTDATFEQVDQTWNIIHVRSTTELANIKLDAAKGAGPGLSASGNQGSHQDCAIFALATASGTTYDIAAARAAIVVSGDEYRSGAERADPAGTISRLGLNGGEMIMVAEAFGQAQVISSDSFAEALQQGKPIMVKVQPPSIHNWDVGHQVVLSRTFQHQGQTWFEMIDSNDGATHRQYLSRSELYILLTERGVTYQAEPGTVVKPLH